VPAAGAASRLQAANCAYAACRSLLPMQLTAASVARSAPAAPLPLQTNEAHSQIGGNPPHALCYSAGGRVCVTV